MTLRTPPTKQSVLALREAVALMGQYGGRPLNEVILDLYERVGVVTPEEPEEPVDPDDPDFTGLTDESFDSTLDGEVVAAGTTSANTVTGSGTLTHSSDWQISGGVSLKIAGTAQHYLTFGGIVTPHATKYVQFYFKYSQAPSDTAWLVAVRDTANTGTAFQWGVNSSGQMVVRTGDSGAVDDTSAAMTVGEFYRVEMTVTGSASASVRVWAEANINSTVVGAAFDTITCPVTPASFSNEYVGLLETIAGTGSATGNLQNESFTGGVNAAAVATANRLTADAVLGSGSLTYSSNQAQDGTISLRINGTTYHYVRYDNASHNDHYVSFYYRHVTNPGAVAYIYELLAGDTTTVAAQVGIMTNGGVRVRNANTGTTGGGTAAESSALSAQWYRFDVTFAGAGGITCRIYTGANLTSTNIANATHTLTCTLAATNFSRERLGLIANASTALDGYVDVFKSDSTALPVGTAAAGGTFYLDRFKTDTTTMPPLITITDPDTPPPQSGNSLAPSFGALFGVTAANTGTKGHTSPAGLEAWLNATGDHYPHIIGRYYSGTRSWVFNAEERQMFDPTTGRHAGAHAIPFLHWKIPGTWAQVAAGAQDAAIDQFIAGIRQYPRKIFMALPHHEPELEINASGNTTADYIAMHRHFVTRIRNAYKPGAPNMEFVMQYTGYSNYADEGFETLYAGDDYVDWIGWDPYPHSFTRNTWDELLNETIASGGTPSYTGFYDWARATHPTKPLMLSEWGLDVNPESGTGMGQANVSTVLTNYLTQVQAFPEVKAVVYWNSLTVNGNYQMQGTSCGDEMSTLIELPWFTQDLDLFP